LGLHPEFELLKIETDHQNALPTRATALPAPMAATAVSVLGVNSQRPSVTSANSSKLVLETAQ
jgi:hypothetical protein